MDGRVWGDDAECTLQLWILHVDMGHVALREW